MYSYLSNMVLSLLKPLGVQTFGFSNGASTPQENAYLHQQQNIQKQVNLLKIHGGSYKKNKTMKYTKKHAKRRNKKHKKRKKGGTKTMKLSDSGRKRLQSFKNNLKEHQMMKPRSLNIPMDNELEIMKSMEKNIKRFTKKNIFGGKKYKHKKRGSKKTMKGRKKQK